MSGTVGTHPLRHGSRTAIYRSTDSLSFVTPVNFPRAVTVRRMANDVTYTMYAALPIHLRVQSMVCESLCVCINIIICVICVCVCVCVCVKERVELFVMGESVRPGILVLVNNSDWELTGQLDYCLQQNDHITFISTLHGG